MRVTERRKAPRLPVSLRIQAELEGAPAEARLTDLNDGGATVDLRSRHEARPGEQIAMRLRLPGLGEEVFATAEVVHGERPEGFGVRFDVMAKRHRRAPRRFLSRRERPAGPRTAQIAGIQILRPA